MQCLIAFQFLILSFNVFGTIIILDKGLMPLERNSVGIQFYIDVENKDRLSACSILSRSKDCCLTNVEEDCNSMHVYGGHYILNPKDTETIVLVYPTLYQHDQIGYCNFVLEYKCERMRQSKRLNVNVPFNTKIAQDRKNSYTLLSHYVEGRKKRSCDSIDQDSLNDCQAVICDLKYNGERPFYDIDSEKCVEAPLCESDPSKELPDVVYVPNTNTCRDLDHPLTVADIYAISTGIGVIKETKIKDDVKVQLKSNCSTISQNLSFLRDIIYGNLFPVTKTDTTDYKKCCESALISILGYIVGVIALVLSFICCLQTLIWLHRKLNKVGYNNIWRDFTSKFRRKNTSTDAKVNSEVRNALLREVIVQDIPLELRDSIVDICQRMDKKVRRNKRYRREDMGSQVSLSKVDHDVRNSTTTSTTSSENCDEREKLLE